MGLNIRRSNKTWWLVIVLLILYALAIRLAYIWPNVIPFAFDHGKDSIAALHLVKTFSPKLIGPWTSISGLFFGPAWYYLIAPGLLLAQFQPQGAVFAIILIHLLMIFITYKYLGFFEALLLTCSASWLLISKSAWNPYPIAWTMLIILIVLNSTLKTKSFTRRYTFLIGFFASLGFHFSSAYAVFYLVCLPLILLYRLLVKKQTLSRTALLWGLLGLILPFIPQLVFEFRHQFIETEAIIHYLTQPSPNRTYTPLLLIVKSFIGEMRLMFGPDFKYPYLRLPQALVYYAILSLSLYVIVILKKIPKLWFEMLVFTVIPLLGLSFSHFNIWYLTPLIGVFTLLLAHVLRHLPRVVQTFCVGAIILGSILQLSYFHQHERALFQQAVSFLPAKQQAIQYIYTESKGEAFAVFHYLPEIYDYPYQYLWLVNGFNGKALPQEFSYKPKEISYIPEKTDLLDKLPKTIEKPVKIFYVVENPAENVLLREWWNQQHYQEIINEHPIDQDLVIYTALPKE